MAGGFYNHLDDPDEYWDDEPLEIKPRKSTAPSPVAAPVFKAPSSDLPAWNQNTTGSPTVPAGTNSDFVPGGRQGMQWNPPTDEVAEASDPLLGVGIFTMSLDDGRLPVHVDVDRNIHNRLKVADFSQAATTGYYIALWKHDGPVIVKGKYSALSVPPSRRAQIIKLLETKSLSEFSTVELSLRRRDVFVGEGPRTDFGSVSVRVTANLYRISRIEINPRWAAGAPPSYIASDIVDCVNQIRQQRPRFYEGGAWAHLSDDALEHELDQYKNYLKRTS